jgi:hypothetical protein
VTRGIGKDYGEIRGDPRFSSILENIMHARPMKTLMGRDPVIANDGSRIR